MKKRPEAIICFGDHWSNSSMGSPGNIMIEFNKLGIRILWINPIPKTNLTLSKTHGNKKVFLQRIINKLKRQSKYFIKYNPSFIILTPVYWPIVESFTGLALNPLLYRIQIWFFLKFLRMKSYAVCNFTSNNVLKYINLKKSHTFFHIAADMHSDLRIANLKQKERLITNEALLFDKAEKIFPASEQISNRILERFGHLNKISILPHGVDVQHFINVKEINPRMHNLKRPIIGYFGSLSFANNIAVLKEIAIQGFSLVLIGEIAGDYSTLMKYQNVHFLGPIAYCDLPGYAAAFDVCIMAWLPSAWITNSNPKKTLEYMALGKPIISISIPYLKDHFNRFIYFADTPREFVNQIKTALEEDSPEKIAERKFEASKHDWKERIKQIIKELKWLDN